MGQLAIRKLEVDATEQSVDYGRGTVLLFAQPPEGPSVPDPSQYDFALGEVIAFAPNDPEPPPPTATYAVGPPRMYCKDGCKRCTNLTCNPAPPPPYVLTGAPVHLFVRKTSTFGPQLLDFGPNAGGPVLHLPVVPGAGFQHYADAFAEMIGQQSSSVLFHLYRVQLPPPVGARVIAIPVEGFAADF